MKNRISGTSIASILAMSLLVAPLITAPAQAQSWPDKPITLIVPFPAGGGTDAFARPLAAQLSQQLGKQVLIDNRGGAGGTVGAGVAARAAPDGYTYFIGAAHHTIAPSIYAKLDYDIEADFAPLTVIAFPPQIIVVNPNRVKATTLKELLEMAKANPGKIDYASAGNGTSHHLAGELFKLRTGVSLTHVPYRGAGPALQDLVNGQVDMMFDGLGSSSAHIRAGRIKALAVASAKRSSAVPDVPTTAEAGVPGYEVSTWYGIWAPKKTPPEIVRKMYDETRKAMTALKETWQQNGTDVPDYTPEAFAKLINDDIKRWAEVVKAANVKLD